MIRKFLIFHSDEDFRLDNFKFKGEGGEERDRYKVSQRK